MRTEPDLWSPATSGDRRPVVYGWVAWVLQDGSHCNNGPFGPLSASELTDNVAMGRRKLFTREDVLNKTIPVFWKHGLAETSVQDLERATGVRKSGLYAEFQDKEDLFVASMRQYFDTLTARGALTKQPLGWDNVEGFLKVCYGSWG